MRQAAQSVGDLAHIVVRVAGLPWSGAVQRPSDWWHAGWRRAGPSALSGTCNAMFGNVLEDRPTLRRDAPSHLRGAEKRVTSEESCTEPPT